MTGSLSSPYRQRMGATEMKIQANDRKAGMDMAEITNALATARTSGFTIMGRTEVGFGGQIQSMTFKRPKENSDVPVS